MKKVLTIVFLITATSVANGQTFSEIFKQKKTQKKYLIQQIAALQVYKKYLQKGYSIVSGGLHVIGTVKKGELNLHKAFFHSLEKVNPKIAHDAKVADILLMQADIVHHYKKIISWLSHHKNFNNDEMMYIHGVFKRLLKEGVATMDALMMVITPGKLKMKDAERLEHIDRLYKDMQSQYTFSKHFNNQIKQMAAYREKEKMESKTGIALYGIKSER